MISAKNVPGNSRGFSYVEITMVLAMYVIISVALCIIVCTGQRFYESADSAVEVQEQARLALTTMARELKRAHPTLLSLPGNCSGSQCQFQLALGFGVAPCAANVVCVGASDAQGVNHQDWSIRYRLWNGQLLRDILNETGIPQSGMRVLAHNVSQLGFSYANASHIITIQVETQRSIANHSGNIMSVTPHQTPLSTSIKLRNS